MEAPSLEYLQGEQYLFCLQSIKLGLISHRNPYGTWQPKHSGLARVKPEPSRWHLPG